MTASALPSTDLPTTALADEVAKFSAIADEWWDPTGKFRPLHKFNPERIRYVRDRLAQHFGRALAGRELSQDKPFAGLSLLDVGCGGGLISEPMARLGFNVTGVDAAERNINVAKVHAERSGLGIDYRHTTPEQMVSGAQRFDVVLALEVVEHVADLDVFLSAASQLVAPGGALIAATLNRTLKSLALAKVGAEYVLRWVPAGTHDWRKFVKPSELAAGLRRSSLTVQELKGLTYDLFRDRWVMGDDLDVNYMMLATKAA
ncbi:MAG: bifunctional 2-polyprenyl-6-hydroxyphenol methylase/3-demethylubiquinol 3-O-methyltransferase UbiG [Rhodospirillaceae bacterium]|nr:bifunctional 2-polyprenyl-6-hydroxyphenol methylase/3-demethylubiquinol 3-O-methyltransferase UbiG [Rhodospirillaceae bacterium]